MSLVGMEMSNLKMGRIGFHLDVEEDLNNLYVPCGDLDVVISYEDNGLGIMVNIYPMRVVDEPFESEQIWFEDIPEANSDYTFEGWKEYMINYTAPGVMFNEHITVRINGVYVIIMALENECEVLIAPSPIDVDAIKKMVVPWGK